MMKSTLAAKTFPVIGKNILGFSEIVKSGNVSGRIGAVSVDPSKMEIIYNRENVPGTHKQVEFFDEYFDDDEFGEETFGAFAFLSKTSTRRKLKRVPPKMIRGFGRN